MIKKKILYIREKKGFGLKEIDPKTIDAVLTYARRTCRRTNLYTDYAFALWKDEKLVTAKHTLD